jgi:succinoglycan biosynthesis transport protein ExoP
MWGARSTGGSVFLMDDTVDLRHYVRAFWRSRRPIVAVMLGVVAVAALAVFSAPPTYEAVAVLSVPQSTFQTGMPPQNVFQVGTSGAESSPRINETLSPQFTSQALSVFATLSGVLNDVRTRAGPKETPGTGLPAQFIATIPQGAPSFVELRVRGSDPEQVARTANLWAAVVSDRGAALFRSEARLSFDFFNKELQNAQSRLTSSEEALRQFKASSRVGELQARIQALTNQIVNYQSRLLDLSVSVQRAEAKLSAIRSQLRDQPRAYTLTKAVTTDPDGTLAVEGAARPNLATLSHINLRTQELNTVYVSLNQEEANTAVEIAALRTERDTTVKVLQDMQAQISSMRGEAATQEFQQTQLTRTVDNARILYNVLLDRQQEAGLASVATQTRPVRIALAAAAPLRPMPAHRGTILTLAAILGLFLGIGTVLTFEYFHISASVAPVPDSHFPQPQPVVAGSGGTTQSGS